VEWIAVVLLGVLLCVSGCEPEPAPEEYVARVGEEYLTEQELNASLSSLPADVDTAEARRQVIEQWVTRSLLLREAQRLNLSEEPEVQEEIEQQRRSILVTALTDRIYEEAELGPTDAEVRAYFQSHREQLTLREPYVRVRHFAARTEAAAQEARQRLATADPAGADTVWTRLAQQHARKPQTALDLADRFVPEGRLFSHNPYLRDELAELDDGDVAPVVSNDSLYHVLQLVRRVPAGTEPELAWVEDQIRRRLAVRARKQMYAREVQRLRNEATARNELEQP
jgi:parvulin-like peptidyl-prolyl isomerase